MTYAISLSREALKALGDVPKRDRDRIYRRLEQLAVDPYAMSNVKKLQGESLFRLRVGDYRVLYLIEDAELLVLVVEVGHRREIYR